MGKPVRTTVGPATAGQYIRLAVLAVPVAGFALLSYAYLTLPDVRTLKTSNPTTTAFMELRDDEAFAQGKTPHRMHRWASYGRISPDLKRAVLVAEDDAFWQHDGVDYEQLQESIETDWARGKFSRGGSTITQQLAKNLYLSPSRDPVRKMRELIIARRLEAALSKTRIFEIYLNVIEWGDGIWGVEAAARSYFGTSAAALSPEQAALLAGAIINPRVYSPAHPNARLLRRQRIILSRMGGYVPPPVVPVVNNAQEPGADEQAAEIANDTNERADDSGADPNVEIATPAPLPGAEESPRTAPQQ
jgi:monofunctional biosynthetic peptidoglycan transglycosylase